MDAVNFMDTRHSAIFYLTKAAASDILALLIKVLVRSLSK